MSWSLKFDEPIVLANGEALHILRDAGEYVTRLPKKEADLSHWQVAASCLLQAAENAAASLSWRGLRECCRPMSRRRSEHHERSSATGLPRRVLIHPVLVPSAGRTF